MNPRTYKPAGGALHETFEIMLQKHPEAFDCIIFPAKSSEHDEILADNAPVGTLLDRDERAQEYDPPIAGRGMITPNPEFTFGASESGLFESFHSAPGTIQMIVSVPGLRTYSLIRWREYLALDSEETVERTVYVADVRPVGRTTGAGMAYICRPLLAEGEAPEADMPQDTGQGAEPGEPPASPDMPLLSTDSEDDSDNDNGADNAPKVGIL